MKIVNLSQGSAAWHAWRAQGVTASEAAVVLGRSPYQTPWRLWAEKTGLCAPEDRSGNPFVQRGRDQEDSVRRGFETRHRTWLLPLCAESATHPVLRCSFDGLTQEGEPVELKVPGPTTWEALLQQGADSPAYRLHWVQAQVQCHIAEASRGWLVFDPVRPGTDPLEFEIVPDRDFLERDLIPACLAFAEAVAQRREPPPDPERDLYRPTGDARARWRHLATQYRQAEAEVTRLEARLQALKAPMAQARDGLVDAMGAFLLADQDGVRVLRYQQRGTVDYPALLAEIAPGLVPDRLEAHRRPAATRVRVTVQGPDPAADPGDPSPPPGAPRRREPAVEPDPTLGFF